MIFRRIVLLPVAALVVVLAVVSCVKEASDAPASVESRLRAARQGVWLQGNGTYSVWTPDHYFVVSFEGDTLAPNIYVGASQVIFHEKGIARKQNIRVRQFPGGGGSPWRDEFIGDNHAERPLGIDSTNFTPGTCNIVDGVIYDAVTEVTEEYILLATCNGDRIKLYDDGRSAYLPAAGGEYFSWRVESF